MGGLRHGPISEILQACLVASCGGGQGGGAVAGPADGRGWRQVKGSGWRQVKTGGMVDDWSRRFGQVWSGTRFTHDDDY